MALFYSHQVVETIKMICRPQESYRHKSANSALAIHGWAECLGQKKKKYNKFQQAENTALFQRILNLPYEERSAGMN